MITRRKALLLFVIAIISFALTYFVYSKNRKLSTRGNRLLKDYRKLIEEISETVIPTTDTPGAKEAKVADYIIRVLEKCTPERDKIVILAGLGDIEDYSARKFSTSFSNCTFENKVAVLHHFEKKWILPHPFLNKVRRKIFGETFFEQIKWLIVSGYCTSELGAKKGLAYDHIPGEYISCTPYQPHQRSWATS